MGSPRLVAVFLAGLLAALGMSCSSDTEASGSSSKPETVATSDASLDAASVTTDTSIASLPTVVVTYSILAAVVRELLEDVADVVTVIPDGQDPHDFEPSPRDVERIINADFVVFNGLDLEEGLDDVLANARNSGVPVFAIAEHVTTLDIVDVNDHSDHGHVHPGADSSHGHDDHDHSEDPHVWLSPHTIREALPALARAASDALGV
ncbi:MAG: metal ABC transporter substrate-binding protein, partial [Ilumatobacteraceae bacterium]